jgi:predicted O-methyltransferase YrrM
MAQDAVSSLKSAVRAAARRCGVHLVSTRDPRASGVLPPDFSSDEARLYFRVRPWTLTSPERVVSLARAAEHVLGAGVRGDFVECGVWQGGSAMVMASALANHGAKRELWLYDVWDRATMPVPVEMDGPHAVPLWTAYQEGKGALCPELETARRNVSDTGLPASGVHFVRGPVEQTIPAQAPERIALLRLDTDYYESTKHELLHLFPRLSSGGVLILDDYGAPGFPGAKAAVDEYFASQGLRLLLNRIDSDARLVVKP